MDCKTKNPLLRDGTNQDDRFLKALDPGSAKIHEFTLRDWMVFAWHYAAKVNFFSTENDLKPDGNWQDFFTAEPELDTLIRELDLRPDHEPHLALFICFLKLMQFPQEELNKFTSRHLKFYYEQVLQIKKNPAQPEKVHLIFELAKNARAQVIPVSTLLDGGKDKNGKAVEFSTDREISVNTAVVSGLKSICHNRDGYDGKTQRNDQPKSIRYASVSNSADGAGKPFKKDEPAIWDPFGNETNPVAQAGFSLASSALLLKEGSRTIHVCFNLEPASETTGKIVLKDFLLSKLKVFLTSEKGWISPADATVWQDYRIDIQQDKIWDLVFTLTIDGTQKPISGYDPKTHGGNYLTSKPIVRFLFSGLEPGEYSVLQHFSSNSVKNIQILADVKGVQSLILANDQGIIDPTKEFYPFSPIPVIGSSLYIGSGELAAKSWSRASVNIGWKGLPPDLREHYEDYFHEDLMGVLNPGQEIISGNAYFTANVKVHCNGTLQPFKTDSGSQPEFKSEWPVSYLVTNENTSAITVLRSKDSSASGSASKFYETNVLSSSDDIYEKRILLPYLAGNALGTDFSVTRFNPRGNPEVADNQSNIPAFLKEHAISLTLNQDFLHQFYPGVYAMAMTKIINDNAEVIKIKTNYKQNAVLSADDENPPLFMGKKKKSMEELLDSVTKIGNDGFTGGIEVKPLLPHIPNQPYTPVIQSISLDYTACEEVDFLKIDQSPKSRLDDYADGSIGFYHEHPFGQLQQHPFLRDQLFIGESRKILLSPAFTSEGELFIGLENATPLSVVNLLFQVSEGSENPLSATFPKDSKINWSCLCNNEWKPLDHNFVLSDETMNLLRSGIVSILLPEEMNADHTFLENGKYWLRVSLPKGIHPDAVCKMIDIQAQAAVASCVTSDAFTDNGFPAGAVTKILQKPASIRTVSQPFHSFGGRPQEQDRDYFKRVSERLRHRNRTVTIWDYERLVLEQFPFLYKAKCLNHTSETCELAPGHVLMIVIPKGSGANSYNPLQPRVSQASLNDIEAFLGGLCSRHITVKARNPDYEPVMFEFSVKFKGMTDPITGKDRLNDELVRYISPWASNPESGLRFGMTIYRAEVIRFIENLDYVDFIKWFVMYHMDEPREEIFSESSRGILVSEQEHKITTLTQENVCNDRNPDNTKGHQC